MYGWTKTTPKGTRRGVKKGEDAHKKRDDNKNGGKRRELIVRHLLLNRRCETF